MTAGITAGETEGCFAYPACGLARVGEAITGETELWMMLRALPAFFG